MSDETWRRFVERWSEANTGRSNDPPPLPRPPDIGEVHELIEARGARSFAEEADAWHRHAAGGLDGMREDEIDALADRILDQSDDPNSDYGAARELARTVHRNRTGGITP